MLVVHGPYQLDDAGAERDYVDLASVQEWSGAPLWTSGKWGATELAGDATVLGPGYVIQPIAIYK